MINTLLFKINARKILSSAWSKFILVGALAFIINLSFIQFSFDVNTEIYTLSIFNKVIHSMDFFSGYDFTIRLTLSYFIYTILILYPFEYGLNLFFRNVFFKTDKFSQVFAGYKKGYSRILTTMLIRDMIIGIFGLVFIIPGVIKRYDYCLVPYILAENKEMSTMEVLKKSKMMMRGYKMFMFSLDMSFVLWSLLGIYTMQLSTVYTLPYYYLTKTQVYLVLSNQMQIKTVTA